ncbi:MAG: hypothetical protein J6C78_08450 [Muribaculaceae bacterium]|nr:hypothetical protein [Muribaculaceae bacterium]
MAKMNLTPASELVDEVWGKVGTPERDEMEAQLKEALNAHSVRVSTNKSKELTQGMSVAYNASVEPTYGA